MYCIGLELVSERGWAPRTPPLMHCLEFIFLVSARSEPSTLESRSAKTEGPGTNQRSFLVEWNQNFPFETLFGPGVTVFMIQARAPAWMSAPRQNRQVLVKNPLATDLNPRL